MTLYPDSTGRKANLFATIGPLDRPGAMLSGHTDVVPVDGQNWHSDPFRLRHENGHYYGRGAADMKGFLACALAAAERAATRPLTTPLHLAFSYDEEIGCVGVRSMIDGLAGSPLRPLFCIIGEPTSMQVATGHKGKMALVAHCTGHAAHSALAPIGLNAIHLASDFIAALRRRQSFLAEQGRRDEAYEVPYSTIHVGMIAGGVALNIVPTDCRLDLEIRSLGDENGAAILAAIEQDAEAIAAQERERFPEAAITLTQINEYPGLAMREDDPAVAMVQSLAGANHLIKLSFGAEAGLFNQKLGIPTLLCGPGSMDQGHKPDEYISAEQLFLCDRMLDRLLDQLA
jgi:acetylornithine deacetylase